MFACERNIFTRINNFIFFLSGLSTKEIKNISNTMKKKAVKKPAKKAKTVKKAAPKKKAKKK